MSNTKELPGVSLALHPAVAASALGSAAAITMFSLHPVLATISLLGALACSLMVRGVPPTFAGLRWQLPAVALVALVNPLFSASGTTLVARLGPVAVYAEALAFGAVAGMVMVASLVWLECLAHVVPPAAVRAAVGSRAPTVALAVSMTMRLVPLLLRRYETVAEAQAANTAAGSRAPKESLGSNVRQTASGGRVSSAGEGGRRTGRTQTDDNRRMRRGGLPDVASYFLTVPKGVVATAVARSGVLLGWALEDSLVCADSMRARGWGAGVRRTSYHAYVLRARDVLALAAVVALALASSVLAWMACSQWRFYPAMPRLVPWWGYLPFALLCAVPSLVLSLARLRWWCLEHSSRVPSLAVPW